jgi:hypothetical protein
MQLPTALPSGVTHVAGAQQSASLAQVVRHAVGPHLYAPQPIVVPGSHAPIPSHVLAVVSELEPMPSEHDAARHVVPLGGNWHTPVVSQPVAPHAPPTGEHAVVQQLPVPVVPHTPLEH